MSFVLINKNSFQAGEIKNIVKVEYDETAHIYTFTGASGATAQYSSETYYIAIIWT